MSAGLQTLKLTYEDYLYLPADGKRHELIDGEHYVTPAPTTKHQAISMNLSRLLGNYCHESKAGRAFHAPTDIVLSDVDVVQPDFSYVAGARRSIITEANLQGAPDLVIEILSPGTRRVDLVTKRHLYEKHGVAEYWVVDPELETVQVHRSNSGRYDRHELAEDASLESPLLPGLVLRLREIFE